jgi:phospholipid/cholesterol/gamma-HCH transport system ATP-binding protein
MAHEQALVDAGHHAGGVEDIEGIVAQMQPTPGMPFRQAAARRQERVRAILHTLPAQARRAIENTFEPAELSV